MKVLKNRESAIHGTIAVIGLGYVGLPLAVEFAKTRAVIGFDICERRITALRDGADSTQEITATELAAAVGLTLTSAIEDLSAASVFIITVPSPIDADNKPDLSMLLEASEMVAGVLAPGNIVVYESTVYPGCTEDDCVPVIERLSGLKLNRDFFVGYSPERINPGDKGRRLRDVVKITSGSTPAIADDIDTLYSSIIDAGTYKVGSIKVAEAAKVIENTQRDLNIALINELALIFDRLDLDTEEVLQAAETKWNFIPFRPGLVGGHCIGIDPFYLTHKAQAVGYSPEVILSGRRINDRIGRYVADRLAEKMLERKMELQGSRVLIMGLTFKENCPDCRNTRVIDIIEQLQNYGCDVEIYDPVANPEDALALAGPAFVSEPSDECYDAIVICVAHQVFRDLGATKIRKLGKPQSVIFDVKYVLRPSESDLRL